MNNMNSTDNLSYIGKVKVDYVRRDGKIVRSSTIKNTGMSELFSFIQSCFAGDWVGAKNLKPNILKAFSGASGEGTFPFSGVEKASVQLSSYTYSPATNDGGSIGYRFVLPYSQVQSNSINLLALYYNGASSNSPSAYIYLNEGEEIELSSDVGNIIITWTLLFKNIE